MEDQTVQPPIQEPVFDPVIPPAQPAPKNNSFLIILSLFLTILVGVVAFLAYQNWQLQKQITLLQNSPSPTPTANLSRDEVLRDWKTYVNTKMGFSLKFPNDWNTPTENAQQISFDNILTIASRPSLTLEQFVAKNLPTDKTPPTEYLNGNINGKRLVYKSGVDQALLDTVIVFSGQTGNVITVSYTDSPGHITKTKTIDQILSTFKFLGTATPSATPVSKACTMEAKLCPNGSYVGRTGPNCEFEPCPNN